MQIKTYKHARDIEEKYLSDLAEREAECWGSKPFDEYKICNNSECKAIFSIEETLGDIMKIRNSKHKNKDFECTECGDHTQDIYKKEEFIGLMKQYFLGEVSALLILDEEDSVEGFGVISKTTIRGAVENEFGTRPNSYPQEETIQKIGKILYGNEKSDDREIICFHQIYLSPIIRNSQLSYQALKNLFEINKEEYADIPVVGEARYDNKFYPISRSMGFQNLKHDKYGYIIQNIQRYSEVTDFLTSHSGYQDFLGDMIKFKKESRNILKEHPELTGRKFYK